MKILIVDDHEDLLFLTAEALHTAGFEVLTAKNAVDALNLLTDVAGVEILFTDISMPGMDGVELAHRALARHQGVRVILTSGYPPPNASIPLACQFLSKPYRFGDLLQAIRKAN